MTEPLFDDMTIKIVNEIFDRLLAMSPGYRAAWPTENSFQATKREWMNAFKLANLTNVNRIKKGLDKARLNPNPFIPSPGQFIDWCKVEPEDIGAPDTNKAYDEACRLSHPCETNKNWSHDAIRLAAQQTGSHFLRTEAKTKSFPIFEKNYFKAIEEYDLGRNMHRIEDARKDTPENRAAYQEYFGHHNLTKKYSKNPDDVNIMSYSEWLAS